MLQLQQIKQNLKYLRIIFFTSFINGCSSPIAFAQELTPIGQTLSKKYGCLSCHAETKKIIGPAFRDIAEKYRQTPSAQQYLALRVKNGGSGIWGVVAMPANKNISDTDLEKITQWVLNH
jgi:cytochrome c